MTFGDRYIMQHIMISVKHIMYMFRKVVIKISTCNCLANSVNDPGNLMTNHIDTCSYDLYIWTTLKLTSS